MPSSLPQRFARPLMLLACLAGSAALACSAFAEESHLPSKYTEAVLDVQGMI